MEPPFVGAYHKTNRAWVDMRARCRAGHPNYEYYGGRGITVTPEWEKFETFLQDMGYAPFPKASLERRDNNGNYEKGNCYWADKNDQARNARGRKTSPDSGITFNPTTGEYTAKSSIIVLYKGTSLQEAQRERKNWVSANRQWKKSWSDT